MKTPTQNEKVLEYLRTHEQITDREAYFMGIRRLSARIFDLRHDPKYKCVIQKRMKTVTNADGSKASIAVYKLIEEL